MLRLNNVRDLTDVMIFWVLLIITLDLKFKHPEYKIKTKNLPEIYSSEIKKIDDYLGYISWTEIYSYSKEQSKIDDAKDILWELISKDPNRPEAYFKLWTIYSRERKTEKCLDICERLFLDANEYDENEYMTAIILLNSKSAMLGKYFLLALQKLQYQYALSTVQPILLYYYGKYIIQSGDERIQKHFISSGISSLQECIRSCHISRHGKIYVFFIISEMKCIVLVG